MKRMYGEFIMPEFEDDGSYSGGTKQKRSVKPGVPDLHFDPGPEPREHSEKHHRRTARQNFKNMNFNNNKSNESGRWELKLNFATKTIFVPISEWMLVRVSWKLWLPTGPRTQQEKSEPSSTLSISSKPFIKKFARKFSETLKMWSDFFGLFAEKPAPNDV